VTTIPYPYYQPSLRAIQAATHADSVNCQQLSLLASGAAQPSSLETDKVV
jgi:hypothetical protein